MSIPNLQGAFNAGELSPELFGRVDLAKYKTGCSTMRNMFVSYRGGAYSRAGTAFVGQCLNSGADAPPVLITFKFSATQGYAIEGGNFYFRFIQNGAYITETPKSVTAITNANPGVFTVPSHGYSTDDWVQLVGWSNNPKVSGQVYLVGVLSANTFYLASTLTGVAVDTSLPPGYSGGATVARIYTLATPYAATDLPAVKWAQSADVMTLTHPNYAPRDLARLGAANWTLQVTTFGTSLLPPAATSATASNTTTTSPTSYQYVVTAVDGVTGEESVASPIAAITDSVDTAVVAGTNTVSWNAVTGATSYNIYRAPPAYNASVPPGSLFGFAGSAFGLSFADTNIVPDATRVPPTHQNPFAVSPIDSISMSAFGNNYTGPIVTLTDPTASGSGAVLVPITLGGQVQYIQVVNGGQQYGVGTSVSITDSGTGSGAAAVVLIGATTGTWPSCVAYFQQRRFYANTNNAPDTYFASQPGAYTNMDSSVPTQDDDAIIGSPWATQVDGIQSMVPMPGGLVILTGGGAWQLSGGAQGTAITPQNQFATPQAFNGCSPLIRPLTINYDILYVQEKGSIVRDLAYNFFVNIYTGTDMTVLSNHLFTDHLIVRWDWAEEPFKLVYAVRDDGVLLSLTYLKEQDVYAWSRHDTNGLFQSVCCVSEPPVNAPYFVVKRLIQTSPAPTWAYYVERMDNRIWSDLDDLWCVDCGLPLPQPQPAAILSASSATGNGNISGYLLVYGGSGYTAPVGVVEDATGAGAQMAIFVTGGVITNILPTVEGAKYSPSAVLRISDPTGSGAVAQPLVTNYATFTASAAVFGSAQAGDVISIGSRGDGTRVGGGNATIVTVTDSTHVVANITDPITNVIPDDPLFTPVPVAAGDWTLTRPVSTVYGLNHLEGMTVSVLADGGVVAPQPVVNGTVTLPTAATSVVVGLPFTAQLQTLYLEMPAQVTVQTRAKNVSYVVARVFQSRGWEIGTDQPDASTEPNGATVPWTGMVEVPQRGPDNLPGKPIPLFTGDVQTNVLGQWDSNGQIALQQTAPLPLNLLGLVPWLTLGDTPSAS